MVMHRLVVWQYLGKIRAHGRLAVLHITAVSPKIRPQLPHCNNGVRVWTNNLLC